MATSKLYPALAKAESISSVESHKVGSVLNLLNTKQWDPSPDWQRFYVWDSKTQNGFIDTLLRGWPIPPIWIRQEFADSGVEQSEIIDGQQRVRTLQKFVAGEFTYEPIQSGLTLPVVASTAERDQS